MSINTRLTLKHTLPSQPSEQQMPFVWPGVKNVFQAAQSILLMNAQVLWAQQINDWWHSEGVKEGGGTPLFISNYSTENTARLLGHCERVCFRCDAATQTTSNGAPGARWSEVLRKRREALHQEREREGGGGGGAEFQTCPY